MGDGFKYLMRTLAACLLAVSVPASASVTMIMGAYRNVGDDPSASGGLVDDIDHSRVKGLAGTGSYYQGAAFVDVAPGHSMGPGCPNCGVSRPGGVSDTAASVAADIGQLRGWSIASADEKQLGTILGNGSLDVSSNAVFGWTDTLTVTGGTLDLLLNMHASYSAHAPLNTVDSNFHRAAGASVFVQMQLRQVQCTAEDGCGWETLGLIAFTGYETEYDGDSNGGYQWIVGFGEERGSSHSVNDARSLRIDGLDNGDYQLSVEANIGSFAFGLASAVVDFSSTGYIGVFGDYTSANGFLYPGQAIPGTDPAIPAPPTPALLALALALGAIARNNNSKRLHPAAACR